MALYRSAPGRVSFGVGVLATCVDLAAWPIESMSPTKSNCTMPCVPPLKAPSWAVRPQTVGVHKSTDFGAQGQEQLQDTACVC